MKVKPYEQVSAIYDGLMKKLDYASWSKYILLIAKENVQDKAKFLELGAGNCKMAKILSEKYKNYYASDISLSMLRSSDKNNLKKICCDMISLPFKAKFDFIFSAFDCVNYILKQKSLQNFFNGINYLLEEDGLFTFDASLETNSLNFSISKSTEGRHNDYQYRMLSKYNKRSRIHSNHFYIRDEFGNEFKEVHKEKIYKIDTFFKLAEKAGLYTEACYDCFTFKDVKQNSQRAQFIMRKIN
ncbi:MAG TPA: methyltransferase domain-containing protein [Ignavibacteriaceae bacterium]|nr:methyltransferase domain-containing protein [Ignavibacteriaceae bacterium]